MILGSIWESIGRVLGALGIILVVFGPNVGSFGRSNVELEKTWKKGHASNSGKPEKWGGPALRTNTTPASQGDNTRLEALHYRAEGTVADIICYINVYYVV